MCEREPLKFMNDLSSRVSAAYVAEALSIQEMQDTIISVSAETIQESANRILASEFVKSATGVQTIADTLFMAASVRPRMLETLAFLIAELIKNIGPDNKLDRLIPTMLSFDFNFMNENWHMAILFECVYQHLIPDKVIADAIQVFSDTYPAKGFEIWICLTWFAPIMEIYNKEVYLDQNNRIVDYYKDGPNKFQYFLDMYQECKKNNWEHFWEYTRTLYFPGSLGALIYADDIDAFQKMATIPGFGIEQIINHTVYEFCPMLWYHPHLLHFATYHGAMEIFHYLLSRGASTSLTDDNSNHLMQFAIASGNTEVIKICETKGCIFDRTGNTAVENYRNDIFHWLISTELIKLDDSIFHSATSTNNVHAMLYCIENGLDPEVRNKEGQTNLHIAASKGHCEAIKLLFGCKGVDINARDSNGLTPFLLSIQANRQPAVELFLNTSGNDLRALSNVGKNALHYSVEEGHPNLVNIIVSLGFYDINSTDNDGNTSLHLAAVEELGDCIGPLLKQPDIDVNATNNDGDTPLIVAIRCQQHNIARRLIEDPRTDINKPSSENNITPIHIAATTGMNDILELLLQKPGINVNAVDDEENTPLHKTIPLGLSRIEAVKLLLKHPDINVNAQDNQGLTPLHACVNDDEPEICQLLLQSPKINPNIQDVNGYTPLHFAIQEVELKCFQMLANFPTIDFNIKDSEGQSPLDSIREDREAYLEIKELFPNLPALI